MLSGLDPRTAAERAVAPIGDWDEIREFTDAAYMPFTVRPTGRATPSALTYSAQVGDITLTHFSYGVPVDLGNFAPEAGRILVLTTLRGGTRHWVDRRSAVEIGAGQSFVADCSRTRYRLEADDDHLQLNLTIPHDLVADFVVRWSGRPADDRLWTHKCEIGGPASPWPMLMRYMVSTLSSAPTPVPTGPLAKNLQELIVTQLVADWAGSAQVSLGDAARCGPGYVRRAAAYIDANAQSLPTVADVARAAGVGVRTLSGGFREYLGTTPREMLRDRRLDGVRRELLADTTATVVSAAGAWGYVNMGVFAAAYRHRFGENPSDTLRRAH
ncbi:helix-turn-helix transcriptional regulator [Rhodococcus sp. Q]|uniref:AraC family transcriptional regulator n=1 Tax=Rhodococcus sp. Q TaxID=2502252 RepID=UPI0010F43CD1|nr:helix-turn-helix transcriptional regulator [Rhodococcus sp. Q]